MMTLDVGGDGHIDYSEFLMASIDREELLSAETMDFLFYEFSEVIY